MRQILKSLSGAVFSSLPFPRQHLYAILTLVLFSFAAMTLLPAPEHLLSDKPLPVVPDDSSTDTALNKQAADTEFITAPSDILLDDDAQDIMDGTATATTDNELQVTAYTVKDDDNLSSIFNTLNLPAALLQNMLAVDSHNVLVHLRPGQNLSFFLDDHNELQKLSIPASSGRQAVFVRQSGDKFQLLMEAANQALPAMSDEVTSAEKTEKQKSSQRPTRVLQGSIQGTFVQSAKAAGLGSDHIRRIIRVFQGRVDFRRDLKKGDSFRVLLDHQTVDDKAPDDAKVLAVILSAKGRTYTAFRNIEDNQFYDATGNSLSMTQSGKFMRYPIPGRPKVSSGFNPGRQNPVTGRIMPHNGTDFPVPVGSKVEATGDGVIVKVAHHPDCGIYIVLRNSGRYSSVYMHLSKALVRVGQKVNLGQVIALSGNTGRTTGPHLHYEFHINDHPVDPMRVDLPVNDPERTKADKKMLAKIKELKRLINA